MHTSNHKTLQTITTLLSLLMASSQPSLASQAINLTPVETQETIKMLQACDAALNASQAANEVDQRIKAKQNELLKIQDDHLVQLEKQNSSITNSPAFWFVAGMLVTGLTVRLVK